MQTISSENTPNLGWWMKYICRIVLNRHFAGRCGAMENDDGCVNLDGIEATDDCARILHNARSQNVHDRRQGLPVVHIFIDTGRFKSFEQMRSFIDASYTKDGEGIPSDFMREVGLSAYEPDYIEAIHHEKPVALETLLESSSYAQQWLPKLDGSRTADAAICVFAPNRVQTPQGCSLEYVGAFEYDPRRD
jgi:hypothetical protein